MSAPKFTPGPWHAWRNNSYWQIDAEAFDGQIGDACASSSNPEFGGSEELGKANATLMAAAPDLYEALKQAVDYARAIALAEGMNDDQEPTRLTGGEYGRKIAVFDVKAARAALSKAEGQQ